MEKRIYLEKRGKNPADIKELNLDNCRSTNIVGLTDEFQNLETLSLINVGLTSLKGFPKLPNLKKLELSDNRISGGFDILETSPKLAYLNLSGNKIKDLESLEALKSFKHLKHLDLFNNEATSTENYREKVFKMLPNLKYLDEFDAEEHEAEESEVDGEGEEEVNGNGEEDSNDDDSSEEDDEEMDDSVDLGVVYSENLDELSDEGDYEAGEDEEDDDVEEEEDDDDEGGINNTTPSSAKGKKRKREDGEEN
ncbi:acidic leucine-rich nuclear phosphoprotein 32 family member A [Euwallacea similis]|uniref:acidic leucine-rich nuclear phosphoprotein 32 family member A n=1 Tax=Euwallacea similis TaxID=1736056 RepID=UPI00344ED393